MEDVPAPSSPEGVPEESMEEENSDWEREDGGSEGSYPPRSGKKLKRRLSACVVSQRMTTRRKPTIVRISIDRVPVESDEEYSDEEEWETLISRKKKATPKRRGRKPKKEAPPPPPSPKDEMPSFIPRRSSRKRKLVQDQSNPEKKQKTEDDQPEFVPEDPVELQAKTEELHQNWRFLTFIHFVEQFRDQLGIPLELTTPVGALSVRDHSLYDH